VQVPDVLRLGALAEVWAEHADPRDLGSAFARYQQALAAWARAEGLSVAEWSAATGPRSPWSLDRPQGAERLARLGYAPEDVTWLRVAAQQRANDPDPTH